MMIFARICMLIVLPYVIAKSILRNIRDALYSAWLDTKCEIASVKRIWKCRSFDELRDELEFKSTDEI